MTKFEILLRLVEIKGLIRGSSSGNIEYLYLDLIELINQLSDSYLEDLNEQECQGECNGCERPYCMGRSL